MLHSISPPQIAIQMSCSTSSFVPWESISSTTEPETFSRRRFAQCAECRSIGPLIGTPHRRQPWRPRSCKLAPNPVSSTRRIVLSAAFTYFPDQNRHLTRNLFFQFAKRLGLRLGVGCRHKLHLITWTQQKGGLLRFGCPLGQVENLLRGMRDDIPAAR